MGFDYQIQFLITHTEQNALGENERRKWGMEVGKMGRAMAVYMEEGRKEGANSTEKLINAFFVLILFYFCNFFLFKKIKICYCIIYEGKMKMGKGMCFCSVLLLGRSALCLCTFELRWQYVSYYFLMCQVYYVIIIK